MSSPPLSWRAAVLRQTGNPLDVVEIARPTLECGQVLVALKYSGVCRSQLLEVRGLRGPDAWLPHLLGHEGVGTVADIGPDVTKVAVGDRVVIGWIKGEGIESASPALSTVDGEPINAGRVTTFSEFTVVSENRVYLQPAGLDDRTAVLFGCALLTGAGMVLNEAQPKPGASILINGLGGIGLSALVATIALGNPVTVVDPEQKKRALALELGAANALHPSDLRKGGKIEALYPEGVDIAIDASGMSTGIEAAFNSIRFSGGQLIFASHPPNADPIRLDPHHLIRGRSIRGSWGGSSHPDSDIPRLATIIEAHGINLEFMVPRVYSLDEINQALLDLERNEALRPLIRFCDDGLVETSSGI
jgi:S-(hydroxymethyl)glutathione dehydrogenase/alcohol dehydrogenase